MLKLCIFRDTSTNCSLTHLLRLMNMCSPPRGIYHCRMHIGILSFFAQSLERVMHLLNFAILKVYSFFFPIVLSLRLYLLVLNIEKSWSYVHLTINWCVFWMLTFPWSVLDRFLLYLFIKFFTLLHWRLAVLWRK